MRPRIAIGLLIGCAALASACTSASPSASASGTTVAATLKEYSIQLSSTDVAAGAVTFNVTNSGTMTHEFVVLKTDTKAADLPLTNGVVNEDDYTSMGEVADLEPTKTGSMSANLAAGHYVIICNLPGHVVAGMVADFTVH